MVIFHVDWNNITLVTHAITSRALPDAKMKLSVAHATRIRIRKREITYVHFLEGKGKSRCRGLEIN